MRNYSPSHIGGVTLKKLKRWPSIKSRFVGKFVKIWSGEWESWWRPEGCGYTTSEQHAGIWEFSKALEVSHHAGPEKRIEYVPLKEFPTP